MHSQRLFHIALTFFFFNCSALHPVTDPLPSVTPLPILSQQVFPKFSPPEKPPIDTIAPWNPSYISSGFSSGVMIEFTGIKKGRTVNAKYSFLEYARLESDSAFHQMRTTINDLRQAFFTLPAGRYLLRHNTPWAKQQFFRDVVILDGHYSIIPIEVFIPPHQE